MPSRASSRAASGGAKSWRARSWPTSSEADMAQSSRDDDEMITGINVTPLVDVALVLLVILMVTATYIAARTIPMKLPKAVTGESSNAALVVNVDKEGVTWLEGKRVEREELRADVRDRRKKT